MNLLRNQTWFRLVPRMFHSSAQMRCPLLYAKTHETFNIENDEVKIGVSDYARKELGDIVFIEAEVEEEDEFEQGDSVATIESVKATSDIYAPCDGTIIEHNHDLIENIASMDTETISEETLWFVKFKASEEDITMICGDLLSKEDYDKLCN